MNVDEKEQNRREIQRTFRGRDFLRCRLNIYPVQNGRVDRNRRESRRRREGEREDENTEAKIQSISRVVHLTKLYKYFT